jgi:hypothetical protein
MPVSNDTLGVNMAQYQDIESLRRHVDERLDGQDKKLDDILAAFNTSKFVVRAVAWLAAVGAGVAVMWSSFHFGK